MIKTIDKLCTYESELTQRSRKKSSFLSGVKQAPTRVPEMQGPQQKDPSVLTQTEFSTQPPLLTSHSLTSQHTWRWRAAKSRPTPVNPVLPTQQTWNNQYQKIKTKWRFLRNAIFFLEKIRRNSIFVCGPPPSNLIYFSSV